MWQGTVWNMDMWKYHENYLERPWILQNEISWPQLRPWNFSGKKTVFFFMAQFKGLAFSWVMNFPLKHPSRLSCHESWLTKPLIKFSWVMKCISSIWFMGHENDACPMGHEFPMKLWGEKQGHLPQARWILLNNPWDEVEGIIWQYSPTLRRIIVLV